MTLKNLRSWLLKTTLSCVICAPIYMYDNLGMYSFREVNSVVVVIHIHSFV